LVTALAARDIGFRYTLVFDPTWKGSLPVNLEVMTAATARSLNESPVGNTSRSPGYR